MHPRPLVDLLVYFPCPARAQYVVTRHGRSLLKGISFSVRERWTHLTICLGNVYLKDTFRYRVSADTYPPKYDTGMTRSTIEDKNQLITRTLESALGRSRASKCRRTQP